MAKNSYFIKNNNVINLNNKVKIRKKDFINLLSRNNQEKGFINKIKIVYRPIICPFNQLLSLIEPNIKIFDIGCGSGQFALLLAEYKSPQALGGIEISDNLINNAKQLLSEYNSINLNFSSYDGKTIPDAIKEYDIITMIDILHHIPQKAQEKFLNEIYTKMKKDTVLLLKDINASSLLVYFNKLHDLVLSGKSGHEIKYHKLKKIIDKIGFKIIFEAKKIVLWYPHQTFLLKK